MFPTEFFERLLGRPSITAGLSLAGWRWSFWMS